MSLDRQLHTVLLLYSDALPHDVGCHDTRSVQHCSMWLSMYSLALIYYVWLLTYCLALIYYLWEIVCYASTVCSLFVH